MLRDTPLTAIITSQYARTRETADPIAQHTHITPDVLPADELDAVLNKIGSSAGGTVLVVHHSNTVPAIVEKLGARTAGMSEREFDRLLIISVLPSASSVVTLRYGAPSAQ
jgi:phosphohistidine phosphatase SixA